MKPSKSNLISLSIVLLVGLIVTYSNHFNNTFHFDDSHTIVENTHIQSLKNIPEFFKDPRMFSSKPDHWSMRPVVTTSLAIDYWIGGGLNPFYFHLSTFLWLVVLCIMLFFIYRRLFAVTLNENANAFFALFAVALFAFHPAIAETINYIISRSDVLSTLFIVISFSIYIFYPTLRKYYLYVIPAFIGVFAKETVLMLIPILFFYDMFFEKRLSIPDLFRSSNFKFVVNCVIRLMPLVVALGVAQAYTIAKTPANEAGLSNPFFPYLLTQTYVWLQYFGTFFLPFHLSADTDLTVFNSIADERALIGILFIAALVFAIVRTSGKVKTRGISFGLIWFAFALLPTSLAPLAEVMNDHRMFFPFIGLSFSVVSTLAMLFKHYEKKLLNNKSNFTLIRVGVCVVLFAFAYGTHQRNEVWRSEETLWRDVTIKSPQNGRGLMNYGLTLMSAAKYDSALLYFERAQQFTPRYYLLEINTGILKNAVNNPAEAETHFKKAISYMPGAYESYYYYADFLKRQKRLAEAKVMIEKAAAINPTMLNNRVLQMGIYQDLEEYDNILKTANEILQFAPGNSTALNFLEIGKKQNSKLDMMIVDASNNPSAEKYLNLSLEFYNRGMFDKCIEASREAIRLKPDYSDAYNNICAAYNNLKQWDKAIEAGNIAVRLNQNSTKAKNNLNWAIAQNKK